MSSSSLSRRDFIKKTSAATAGTLVAASAALADEKKKIKKPVDTSKILNYNENMEYRRFGKTELMVSAVSMGGHWKRVDVMDQDLDKNRYDVVSKLIDSGINYIDACWGGEVMVYSKALKGRRDKMYLALSNGSKEPRNKDYRTAKKLLQSLDELLLASGQEYTDFWRITALEPGGRHSFDTCCEIVAALDKAKQQGKARFGGFSTHDRRWIKFMVEYFPQIDAVCFPYTAMSKKAPKGSLFTSLKKHDVGAFGIKPFASNSLFKGDSSPGSPHKEEDDRRARMALRYILYSTDIVPIPGLINDHQIDNVLLAIKERREQDLMGNIELETPVESDEGWACLPKNYEWLKEWEYV
jgi:predicted aldo/keto reductase-like oxidoreductase